ncbi:SinR family protein [Paraburkholderia sp. Ac-20340]|uniref:hypothetical protein n=1 Tax=Paraburkholderia sp. Ac-20340 TaxID=2703888 RepID=UPI00197FAA66|nr:hypothetical protein [Paraburkholderia sp. Ac-20340]MBN3851995.1 SinR family protein [Paraburkholderia sp. Ac-20340]
MAIYFVGYDLTKKPFQNYENLIAAIKGYEVYWGNLDSTWLISTNHTAEQIRNNLVQHIHKDDRLLVAKIAPEAAWTDSFSDTAKQWLRNAIPGA